MVEIMQSSKIESPATPVHPWDRIPCQQQTFDFNTISRVPHLVHR